MANLVMALDEIISQTKKTTVGGSPRRRGGAGGRGRRVGNGGGRAFGSGGAPEEPRTSARTRFPRSGFVSGEVPAGRWKHDKFFEMNGGNRGGAGAKKQLAIIGRRASVSIPGAKASGGIAARLARKAVSGGGQRSGMVKLQISNLPNSVLTSDLEELFQEYNCYGVAVHYDETGTHLGTADLFTDQQSAKQILQEFKDIAVDGREIKFCIVAESGAAAAGALGTPKPSIRDRLRRVANNPIRSRRSGLMMKKRLSGGGSGRKVGVARAGAAGRRARLGIKAPGAGADAAGTSNKAKTAEELDMELDNYMKKK